ncbi:MAG TPA: secondary thiamine-phosphate synthase enzyme YjbQ [Ruminiclostridium sp.]|nr:secondary thiamine-phosphate synthase enzyme YjbQ [Ruminiclostridium sp.]
MAGLKEFILKTGRNGFYNITRDIENYVRQSKITEGTAIVFCPHTTAGITINENADPDVVSDMTMTLDKVFPKFEGYRHMEGNSDAHVKSTLTGPEITLIITGGKLLLGTWQGVYFAEYDGPRNRRFFVKINEG